MATALELSLICPVPPRPSSSASVIGDAGRPAVEHCAAKGLVPELPFQHPAHRAPGQLRPELDVTRQREVGKLVDTPPEKFRLGEFRTCLEGRRDLQVVFGELT